MKFTVYSAQDGRVLYSGEGDGPHHDPGVHVQVGELLLEGAQYTGGWIDSDGAHHAQPPRPTAHHTWDWQSKAWLDPRTLADLKRAKALEINQARERANFTTFPHAGKLIVCDTLSRSDIDGTNGYVALHGALPPGWPGGWKALDNSYTPIADVAGWKAFYDSMYLQGQANFAQSQQLKSQLADASTPEQIALITWDTNA